jgi:hypothetical protein
MAGLARLAVFEMKALAWMEGVTSSRVRYATKISPRVSSGNAK